MNESEAEYQREQQIPEEYDALRGDRPEIDVDRIEAEKAAAGKTPVMTEAQDRAFAFLNNRYGDARLMKDSGASPDTDVRIEGVDEDGDVRARWVVRADGVVIGAWDPDYALDSYDQEVIATDD